jgi:hypothetical protein
LVKINKSKNEYYEVFYLLGCNAMQSAENQLTFWRNMLPPSSGVKSKASFICCLLYAGFLLGLLFSPEDGGDMFLQKVGRFSTGYMALYPRR